MYNTVYDAWLKEKENTELQALPEGFYPKLAGYIHKIKQESRMLDKNSVKARLISQELANVRRLAKELAALRFQKLVSQEAATKSFKSKALTPEEEKLFFGMNSSFEEFQSFLKNSLQGKPTKIKEKSAPLKKKMLRFLEDVPAIVGANLKIYGPFVGEDVAALPIENAKVLIKHGVAMEIETG